LNQDFASPIQEHHRDEQARQPSTPLWHIYRYATAFGICLFIGWLISLPDFPEAIPHDEWLQATIVKPQTSTSHTIKTTRLKTGDTASSALQRLGFSYQQILAMQHISRPIYSLTHVQAGHIFQRQDDALGMHVWYTINQKQRLHIQYSKQQWSANMDSIPSWHHQHYAKVKIQNSLFWDAQKAGIDSHTIMNLVDVFAWDIDFTRELRKNDQFWVLYDVEEDTQGKQINSTILAAEFINQGHHYSALRYTLHNGETSYYSFNGHSLRKTYLKAPVKFSRISSRFNLARKHPVLGYTRAHKGVDYAAPRGTPIHAIGRGRITFAGWSHGYGNLIKIQHTNRNHSTRYGHMLGFARGIHRGVWVKQGQVIGYVGKTGLATGYHLHFEFRIRNRAVNPLSIKHTPSKPVPKSEMAHFQQQVQQMKHTIQQAAEQQRWG